MSFRAVYSRIVKFSGQKRPQSRDRDAKEEKSGVGASLKCDVMIVGAGLAGASLACALRGLGMKIVVIESHPPRAQTQSWDERVYALSPASQTFLDELGLWGHLAQDRIEAVSAMRIFGDDGNSRLEFSAYQCAVDRLASIVESGAVHRALWRALETSRDITLLCPSAAKNISWGNHACEVVLNDGESVVAKLVVAADGMHSMVRAAAGIEARITPAGQHAVVANFTCSLPHRGLACQWFGEDGVLAWLPLPGRAVSMVWSTHEQLSEEMMQCGAQALCERVVKAGGGMLGEFDLIGGPAAFPLAWLSVDHRVRERLALIGDAAHVVHPLAGQGINLGLGDARELALQLRLANERGGDPGELLYLRKFERARAEAILAMRIATRSLKGLFEPRGIAVAKLRNMGLNLTHRTVVIKNMLARHAMG